MNHTLSLLLPLRRPLHACILLSFLSFAGVLPRAIAESNNVSNIGLKLITEGLGAPMALAPIPDGSGRMLLAEQSGVIHLLDRNGKRAEQLFLDLRSKMVAINKGMEERGLLGLALHPRFNSNRKFYVVYSAPLRTNAPPKWDHAERLSEFKAAGSDFASADPGSERMILEIDQPYHGKAIPSLAGEYVFADWSRSMAIPDGTLLVATIPSGSVSAARWTVEPLALKEFPNGRIKSFIWALGEDADGELYVLANGINSAFGTRGKVVKLVPQ